MGQISSFNIKKSTDYQIYHNSVIRPKYAIGGEVECNRKAYQAQKLKEKIIQNAINAYNETKPKKAPKFKAKSYEWSAVVNIKPDTTMNDLECLARHFEEKYGFQCYQIAIHRDEGHIDENGEKQINHHAHMEFITLDKETGKNRQRDIKPQTLRQIQTEVAEILQMERGVDKRISKRKRIEPRKYAQMKEEEKKKIAQKNKEIQELQKYSEKLREENINQELTKKEIRERIEQERKAWLNENKTLKEQNQELLYQQADYMRLRALREQEFKTIEALNLEIQKLKQEIQEKDKKNQELQQELTISKQEVENIIKKALENQKLKYEAKIKALESNLNNERIKNNELEAKIIQNDFRAISELQNDEFETNSLMRAIGMRDYKSLFDDDENYIEQNQNEQKNDLSDEIGKKRKFHH